MSAYFNSTDITFIANAILDHYDNFDGVVSKKSIETFCKMDLDFDDSMQSDVLSALEYCCYEREWQYTTHIEDFATVMLSEYIQYNC